MEVTGIVARRSEQQVTLAVTNEKLLEQFSLQLNYLLRRLRLANNPVVGLVLSGKLGQTFIMFTRNNEPPAPADRKATSMNNGRRRAWCGEGDALGLQTIGLGFLMVMYDPVEPGENHHCVKILCQNKVAGTDNISSPPLIPHIDPGRNDKSSHRLSPDC